MTIKKKIWPKYFEAVASGKKNYELRLDDFTVNEGDTLVLEEWNPQTNEYTGRSTTKTVSYVGKFKPDELPFWPAGEVRDKELQIISIK